MNKYFNEQSLILITGASSGIGKNLASILIKNYGAKVLGVARSEQKLQAVKNELKDNFSYLTLDVSKEESWQTIYNYITENSISLTGIINSAGVLPEFSSFNGEYFNLNKNVIDINYLSVVYSAKYLLPVIKKQTFPTMINVSSSASLCPFAGISLYSSTKAAVTRFSECLSFENKKVNIVTVMPGFTRSEVMRNQAINEKEKGLIDKISASPIKVAKKILKKASRGKNRVITGFDAHFMNFLYKVFPRTSPKLIGWFLKKTKMKVFEKI